MSLANLSNRFHYISFKQNIKLAIRIDSLVTLVKSVLIGSAVMSWPPSVCCVMWHVMWPIFHPPLVVSSSRGLFWRWFYCCCVPIGWWWCRSDWLVQSCKKFATQFFRSIWFLAFFSRKKHNNCSNLRFSFLCRFSWNLFNYFSEAVFPPLLGVSFR